MASYHKQSKGKLFFSVPSQYSNQQKSSLYQDNLFGQKYKSLAKQSQNSQQKIYIIQSQQKQIHIDLQNLDIEPIENKNGDNFFLNTTKQHKPQLSSNYSKSITLNQNSKQLTSYDGIYQSQVWVDVFYGKKNIMNLLLERNQICDFYKLNSQKLKENSALLAKKRTYNDTDLSKYIKELFSQSPSYNQYDLMSFAIIPQITAKIEKYYVFLGTDQKYVPLCKSCSTSAYLILNIQNKISSHTEQSLRKSSIIKGKIYCSNTKCKKKILGQFIISNQDKKSRQSKKESSQFFITEQQFNTDHKLQNKLRSNSKKPSESVLKKQDKNLSQLNQKQKMLIKKAVMRVIS